MEFHKKYEWMFSWNILKYMNEFFMEYSKIYEWTFSWNILKYCLWMNVRIRSSRWSSLPGGPSYRKWRGIRLLKLKYFSSTFQVKKRRGGGRGLDSAFSLLFAIRGLSSSSSPPTLSFTTSQIYRTTVSCDSALEGKIITILS